MASHVMTASNFSKFGFVTFALGFGVFAPVLKDAAWRQVARVGWGALEDDTVFSPATAHLRHRRHQGFGVGVGGAATDATGLAVFATGGSVRVSTLELSRLETIWSTN